MCLNSCFTSGNSRIFARIINYYDVCRIAYIFTTNHLKKHFRYMNNWYSSRQTVVIKVLRERELFIWWKIKFLIFFLSKYSRNLTLLTSNLIGPESRLSLRLKAFLGRILKGNSTGFFFNMLGLTNEWKIKKIEIVIKILWSWKKILFK